MLETLRLSWAVTNRNWIVYKKDFIANISPSVSDPILFMFSLGMGIGGYVSNMEGMSYMKFLAPGLIASSALLTSFFETSYGFYVRMTYENIFKAVLTTPIGVTEIVIGEFLWVALKGLGMSFITALVFLALGLADHWAFLPLLAIPGVLIGITCGAIGLISSCLVRNINQFQTIYSFLISPLFFFSGIFFPFEKMPAGVRAIAEILPFSHGVILAQSIFWNKNLIETFWFHGSILLVQSLILAGISYWLIQKKLRT